MRTLQIKYWLPKSKTACPVEIDKKADYKPQLDALRAFAVVLVIISHWFSEKNILNTIIPTGIWGVTLFFVLSGYLITGILLKTKQKNSGFGKGKIFKIFYIRRSLRIFPVYFLLLFILFLIGNKDFLLAPGWHALYLSNFYFFIQEKFTGSVSHFWSLSVEEQFYLFWPFVVLWVPWRKLPVVFLSGVMLSIVFRVIMVTYINGLGRLLMPGSLDSFCLGGAFAYGQMNKGQIFRFVAKQFNPLFFLSFIAVVLIEVSQKMFYSDAVFLSLYFPVISLFFALLIYKAALGFSQPLIKTILSNRFLIYIGKISYGIYLFHNFIPYFYGFPFPQVFTGISLYFVQLIRFLVLIGIATSSWFLFERPLNDLKRYFTYSKVYKPKKKNGSCDMDGLFFPEVDITENRINQY